MELDALYALFLSDDSRNVALAFELEAALALDTALFWNHLQTRYCLYYAKPWTDWQRLHPVLQAHQKAQWIPLGKTPHKIVLQHRDQHLFVLKDNPYLGQITTLEIHFQSDAPPFDLSWLSGNKDICSLHFVNFLEETLPDALADMPRLSYFSCRSKTLRQLPQSIARWHKLETLDLSDCPIADLPPAVGNLRRLWQLRLQRTEIEDWQAVFRLLRYLPNLRRLAWGQQIDMPIGRPLRDSKQFHFRGNPKIQLDFADQRTLVRVLRALPPMRSIVLSGIYLKSLPKSIYAHPLHLRTLSLYDNRLTDLPDHIALFERLTYLNLNANKLKQVPAVIRRLKWLEVLRLNDNPILALPEWIGELRCLRVLELNNTLVDDLPASLANCTHLEHLAMRYVNMHEVPTVIGQLHNLRHVDLSQNCLTTVPAFVWNHAGLHHLVLDYNTDLSYFPPRDTAIPFLFHLSLRGCYKIDWRSLFDTLKPLSLHRYIRITWQNNHSFNLNDTSLWLTGASYQNPPIRDIAAAWILLEYMPQLEYLNLSSMPLHEAFDWNRCLPILQRLHLFACRTIPLPDTLVAIRHPLQIHILPNTEPYKAQLDGHPYITCMNK